MKIDDKFVSKVLGSAKLGRRAQVTDPMCRLASWMYAPFVPISPVSRRRARRLHELLPKAGIVVIDLILGAGQPDRTVSDADVLLGQHVAEDGLR